MNALFRLAIEGQILILVDVGKGKAKSITNDVEWVLSELHLMLGDDLDGMRIIYRDTMQRWDGIAHRGAAFLGFVHLNEPSRPRAVLRALEHRDWPV